MDMSQTTVPGSASRMLQGAYQPKCSGINMLTDPTTLKRLEEIHQNAKTKDRRPQSPDSDIVEDLREQLTRNIAAYNMRNQFGKFTVLHTEGFNFEGAMEFHLDDTAKKKSSSKSVKISNKTNVEEVITLLTDKFSISKHDKRKKVLYQIYGQYEILLATEECPLDIAVNSKHNIRFVMRLQKMEPQLKEQSNFGDVPRPQRKALSQFFGVDNSDLKSPFASTASLPTVEPVSPLKRQGTLDSISSNSSSGSTPKSASDRPLSGLLLKTQTARYRRRGHSNEETNSDSGTPYMKRKSTKKRFRTKSLTTMVRRSMSFRTEGKSSKELSTEEATPGLLKIFGAHISPEAQYKSVLATRYSCAVELIKEVLERYSLPRDSYQDYVMCDVIGNFHNASSQTRRSSVALTNMRDERVWVTECLRPLKDAERPLELSDFWKPEDGYLRRFEIRKRAKVETSEVVDTVTHGINVNAKRIQMSHGHANTIDVPDEHQSEQDIDEFGSLEDMKRLKKTSSATEVFDTRSMTPDTKRRVSEREETESSDEPTAVYNLAPPRDCPYLLTLKGKDPDRDLILYLLHQQWCLLGSGSHDDRESAKHLVVDITLEARDIFPHHCWIFQRHASNSSSSSMNIDECVYDISIEPINNAPVTVNGSLITTNTQITSGDIICVGTNYMFMFKDPATEQRDIDIQNFHPIQQIRANMPESESEVKQEDGHVINSECPKDWVAPNAFVDKKAQQYYADLSRLKIAYHIDREDAVLDYIGSMQPGRDGRGFGLAPAYVLVMSLEHAAYNYSQEHTKALVIRTAALVHSLAWDKTKELASKQPKKLADVHKVLRVLLPHLRAIVYWMANALELLHFFHTYMKCYIGQAESEEETVDMVEGSTTTTTTMTSIQDEITAELEEVVMYTFQQSVYYLTKTLYIALPNILDSNPFEDKGQDERSQGMEEVIHVFQTTFDMLYSLDVHPQITSQLFAYLLFFTNASLFNMFMERGLAGNFFKWSKGVQIRGNLDDLESWLQDHGLAEQLHFIDHVSMAADLLATPKLQLMQNDWSSIRRDFPALNAAQVQQILSKYQLGTNQTRPKGWFPSHDQVQDAMKKDDILESFDNHPPLVLPISDFKLNLQHTPSDPSFRLQVQRLCKAVTEVTVHLGQPAEPKVFSPRFKASSLDDDILIMTRSESAPFHLTDIDKQEIEPSHYSAPSSPTYDQTYHHRQRKLSRVLEAEAIVENAESNSEDIRTITMMMTTPTPTPTHPPAISVTPPKPHKEVLLMESHTQLLEPPSEFANGNEDEEVERGGEVEAEMYGNHARQEEVKPEVWEEISPQQPDVKDENQNHELHHANLELHHTNLSSRNDSVILLDDTTDEQYIRGDDKNDSLDDVFVVDLDKCDEGLGLGLIDGMHTALHSPGIYVRKLVAGGAAVNDGRLKLGDRILAVNGTSLVGADYQSAMHLIKTSGEKLRFLVAKSETTVTMKITSSSC